MNTQKFCEALADWPDDKQTTGHFFRDGCYCAIGWLLHKAGVSDEVLHQASVDSDEVIYGKANQVLAQYDMRYLPFDSELQEIFRVNDNKEKGGTPKQRVLNAFCGV